jgi:hypothetical protein
MDITNIQNHFVTTKNLNLTNYTAELPLLDVSRPQYQIDKVLHYAAVSGTQGQFNEALTACYGDISQFNLPFHEVSGKIIDGLS